MMNSTVRVIILLKILIPIIFGSSVKFPRSNERSYSPRFEKKIIETDRDDGYWIESFRTRNRSSPGLLAFGLGSGLVKIYQNLAPNDKSLAGVLIQKLNVPVATDQVDITGDGLIDIVICYQYGNTILDTDAEGGKISWLENPGETSDEKQWKNHYVGRVTAMHRLRIGHFTQKQRWEIIGLPITNGPYDVFSPLPVYLFREPDNLKNATQWSQELINDTFFSVIHDSIKINNGELDSLIIASSEGINWLYFDQNLTRWHIKHIGDGETQQKQQIGYYGSGGLDIGRVQNERFAYIPAVEPFHGNTVAVYVKDLNSTLEESKWERYILDVHGYPNQNGEGTGHYVVCGDFDQDGDDEFLIAHRGPPPNQGVFFYKPIDIKRGIFSKWKIDGDSAARIAVADFDNDDILDFATISYSVPGYYTVPNASIAIHYNRFVKNEIDPKKEIQVSRNRSDMVFKVPRPSAALEYQSIPFMSMNTVTMSLIIIPPYSSYRVDSNIYVKVLFGNITWFDSRNGSLPTVAHYRTPFTEPRSIASLLIESDEQRVKTGSDGALLLVFQTISGINSIPFVQNLKNLKIENSLPEFIAEDVRQLKFDFNRYDTIDQSEYFRELDFYNMKGVQINFIDTDEMLCYLQFWAAGQGVNAGVHNHRKDTFCEVHVTLINGSGEGGMHFLESSKDTYDVATTSDSAFKQLPLPTLYEHGALWDVDRNNNPVIRDDGTVVYPWHKWQAGVNRRLNQSYDIWLVIEFDKKFGALPSTSSAINLRILYVSLMFPLVFTCFMI